MTESPRDAAPENSAPALGKVRLEPGEVIQAQIFLNLNSQRRFAASELILTNQRLHWLNGEGHGSGVSSETWSLVANLRLDASVLGGLGKLKLSRDDQPLSTWWFTAALNSQVDRFVGLFHTTLRSLDAQEDAQDRTLARPAGSY